MARAREAYAAAGPGVRTNYNLQDAAILNVIRACDAAIDLAIHNYERFRRDDITYLVSGGGGAKPVPVLRLFGELSKLDTAVNFHYIRFRLESGTLQGTMVRFDLNRPAESAWAEPDRFEVEAKDSLPPRNSGIPRAAYAPRSPQ